MKGNFKPSNPQKYMGDPGKIIYRSQWELKCMLKFDTDPSILSWASEELAIPYFDPVTKNMRRYFPDFVLKIKKADGTIRVAIAEVKPSKSCDPPVPSKRRKRSSIIYEAHMYANNMAKWQAAKAFAAERDWDFMVLTEHEIFGKRP